MEPISVTERLPENKIVLAFDTDYRDWYFAVYNGLQWEAVGPSSRFKNVILASVTHWLELIDPTLLLAD